jgi:serine/threonine protein phosphatase 1
MRPIYAIGDVHGCSDLLTKLLTKIRSDAARAPVEPLLVFLGDYVDRGPDSRGVLDLVLAGVPGFETVRLRGNHEDLMRAWLFGGDRNMAACWMVNGAAATLRSYGLPSVASPAEARAAIPEAHKAFIYSGGTCLHDAEPYLFVHAGILPGVPVERQTVEALTWIRSDFLESDADHGRIVVHGHSPAEEPEVMANRIGIDTGAFFTDRLTCLALGNGRRFIYAEGPNAPARPAQAG